MSKRPPYLEVIVTVLVMAFLTLVVVGGFDTRNEGFGTGEHARGLGAFFSGCGVELAAAMRERIARACTPSMRSD